MKIIVLRRNLIALVLFVLMPIFFWYGCTTKKKKIRRLQNFDSEAWAQDKNGCSGNRLDMKDQLLAAKYFMRGLMAEDIEEYLGKPDAQELYNRSQRYYIYFLEPGPKCQKQEEHPQALFVRFSAVGIANEFTIKAL